MNSVTVSFVYFRSFTLWPILQLILGPNLNATNLLWVLLSSMVLLISCVAFCRITMPKSRRIEYNKLISVFTRRGARHDHLFLPHAVTKYTSAYKQCNSFTIFFTNVNIFSWLFMSASSCLIGKLDSLMFLIIPYRYPKELSLLTRRSRRQLAAIRKRKRLAEQATCADLGDLISDQVIAQAVEATEVVDGGQYSFFLDLFISTSLLRTYLHSVWYSVLEN